MKSMVIKPNKYLKIINAIKFTVCIVGFIFVNTIIRYLAETILNIYYIK